MTRARSSPRGHVEAVASLEALRCERGGHQITGVSRIVREYLRLFGAEATWRKLPELRWTPAMWRTYQNVNSVTYRRVHHYQHRPVEEARELAREAAWQALLVELHKAWGVEAAAAAPVRPPRAKSWRALARELPAAPTPSRSAPRGAR